LTEFADFKTVTQAKQAETDAKLAAQDTLINVQKAEIALVKVRVKLE
jgi:hypothetical protein